jgi:undecaprenyl-diphosphatase
MIPVFVVGMFFKDYVENLFESMMVVGLALIVTAMLLFFSDFASKKAQAENGARNGIRWWQALVVGIGQACAVIPGLSRSGTTITAGLATGLKREFAVKFAFLMSLPAVLGANILSFVDAAQEGIDWTSMPAYLVGTAVAMVTGIGAITLLKRISRSGHFGGFAYYCWIAGALSIILTMIF